MVSFGRRAKEVQVYLLNSRRIGALVVTSMYSREVAEEYNVIKECLRKFKEE